MWKEKLPNNCPPNDTFEMNRTVYRFLKGIQPQDEDFLPYVWLYPDNPRYRNICKAYALSSFDTKENALKSRNNSKRKKNIGNYICEVSITEEVGKNVFNNNTGHFSTWLYNSWNYSNFVVNNIEEID